MNFHNHTLTLLDGTDVLLDIPQELPPPKQISLPEKEYFEMVKWYTNTLGMNESQSENAIISNELYLKE
ncbi:13977_t:CDS:2 [Acaulospora colombiana]|uniref:13977_t:CDS:1 n=1 Tax=Acaulospora colombiana TaxID=27376 RepID=A0ACA9JYZ6_9GLOM|nr:13977_t:CDS:2 [Acaulospora colombiana]